MTKPSDLELPHKFLEVGDSGREVQKIQEALKVLSFNVGTTDGFFGPKTEAAVKQLQSTNHNIEINGTYDEMTKTYLEELLR